jgi:hypothetical protein
MLAIARFLIKFVAFSRWKKWLDIDHMGGDARPPHIDDDSLGRDIGRIVRMAARHVPWTAVCLPQAMAAQWMLRRRKDSSKIVIGVDRKAKDASASPAQGDDGQSNLDLHAWLVSSEGIIVTGKHEYKRFRPFTRKTANSAQAAKL